jgi:hypothetical protein
MKNLIKKLIFFQPIRFQDFCNNWRPHSEDFSEKNLTRSDVNWYFFVSQHKMSLQHQKNRKRINFYRTLSENFKFFFIGTIFHSDEKILIKKIASVLSQSDHSISIGFFIGIKIDYPYCTVTNFCGRVPPRGGGEPLLTPRLISGQVFPPFLLGGCLSLGTRRPRSIGMQDVSSSA